MILDLLKKPDDLPEKFEHKNFGKIVRSNGQFSIDSENKVNNHFLEALNFFQEEPPQVEDAIADFSINETRKQMTFISLLSLVAQALLTATATHLE